MSKINSEFKEDNHVTVGELITELEESVRAGRCVSSEGDGIAEEDSTWIEF